MRALPTQLSLDLNLSEPSSDCSTAKEAHISGPAEPAALAGTAVRAQPTDPVENGNSPRPRTATLKAWIFRHWQDWWHSTNCPHPIHSANAITQFAQHLDASGKTPGQVRVIFSVVRSWLAEPKALQLAYQILTSATHAERRERHQRKTVVFGRAELETIIRAADPLSPTDARDVSALLVQFETQAAPDQIFGFYLDGRWHAMPVGRSSLSFMDDGTSTLEIAAMNKLPARTALLSAQATHWLRVWLESRVDGYPELFIAREGPLKSNAWRCSIRDLTTRAGLPGSSSLQRVRRGLAQELSAGGADDQDVLLATPRRGRRKLRRAQPLTALEACCPVRTHPSLMVSKRRHTRMRAYCRDLFAGVG